MADSGFVLLLVAVAVAFLHGGETTNATAAQLMQKFEDESKYDKQTAKAVEQLTVKIQELQEKLQNAELRVKDEVRREIEAESALRCSASTLRLETKLDNCKNESLSYMKDMTACLAKDINYERIKDDYISKLEKMQSNVDIICRNNSEILQEKLAELSTQINASNTLSAESINELKYQLQKIEENNTTLLNLQLDACKTESSQFKTEIETMNSTIQTLQENLATCIGRSDGRENLDEFANETLVAESSTPKTTNMENGKIDLARRNELVAQSGGRVITIGNGEKVTVTRSVVWGRASDICASFGMKLISLQTREKWLAVKKYFYNKELYFWTSGRKVDDVWTWTATNESISYTDWWEGNPNDSGDVCIYFGTAWNDVGCSKDTNYVICE